MAKLASTGLAGLDAHLGGGVPAGTVHAVFAEPSNAQELFAYHFAAGGLEDGAKVHLVSTNASEEQVRSGMARVAGKTGKLRVTYLGQGQGWRLPAADAGERLVVDSFSEIAARAGWDASLERLDKMRETLRGGAGNLLITVAPESHTARELALIRIWADGVFELDFKRRGLALDCFLKIAKMRGVTNSSGFLAFKETEGGLALDSTRRVA